jgi:biopolymer transport protein ExbB
MFTFKAISVLPVAQQSQALASGISAAMNTTIFGLIVAIPIVLAYQWILSQSKQVIDDLDEQSVRLINTIREL